MNTPANNVPAVAPMSAPLAPELEAPTTSTALVVSQEQTIASFKRGLEPDGLDAACKLAATIAKTGYCGITTMEEGLARMMFGRELGLSAMVSIRSVYVVNGRPGIDAGVMHALCLQNRACEYFEPVESTRTVATYRAKRRGRPEVVLSWTIEQAHQAGLLGGRPDPKNRGQETAPKDNWVNYPDNMLRARCIANLARMVFPESINGMYTPDEIDTEGFVVTPVAEPPPDVRVIDATKATHDATRDTFLAAIKAVSSKEEKSKVRAEIKAAQEDGSLVVPWLDEVTSAYNARFPSRATQQATAAAPPAPAPTPQAPKSDPKPATEELDRGDDPNRY